jgi:hypothetical protein
MQYAHRLQASRFELKYIINEALVSPIREFLKYYLSHDEHALAERNWEYDIHSLYLDSPSLALCRATLHGLKNRFKLRIRYYDHDPQSPVFFEIKRRANDVILKQRARVRHDAVAGLLAGDWPRRTDLVKDSDADFGALQRFCSLRDTIGAEGKVFVSYSREAYVTPNDNSVRVTFDHTLRGTNFRGRIELPMDEKPVCPKIPGIILEIKFTDRFPNWMHLLVETFDLQRRSMAKYVACIMAGARTPSHTSESLQEAFDD